MRDIGSVGHSGYARDEARLSFHFPPPPAASLCPEDSPRAELFCSRVRGPCFPPHQFFFKKSTPPTTSPTLTYPHQQMLNSKWLPLLLLRLPIPIVTLHPQTNKQNQNLLTMQNSIYLKPQLISNCDTDSSLAAVKCENLRLVANGDGADTLTVVGNPDKIISGDYTPLAAANSTLFLKNGRTLYHIPAASLYTDERINPARSCSVQKSRAFCFPQTPSN